MTRARFDGDRPSRRFPRSLTLLLVAVMLACSPSVAHGAVCADHPNRKSAQIAKDTRDADGDGIYCEALPCPCLKPGAAKPKPRPSSQPKPNRPAARKPPKRQPVVRKPKPAPLTFRGVTAIEAIDGDTLTVELSRGTSLGVRLVGVAAPEDSANRNGTPECGGAEASLALAALIDRWPEISLRIDTKAGRYDKFGRLLAYVIPDDEPGTTYQQELLLGGSADVLDGYGGFKRSKQFQRAADDAATAGAGSWTTCAGDFHRELAAPAAIAGDPAGDRTIVQTNDGLARAGTWKVTTGSLRSIINAYGEPDNMSDCSAVWTEIGVVADLIAPGYQCDVSPSKVAVKALSFTGPGWRTNRGLTIGDDRSRADELYPKFFDDDGDLGDGFAFVPLLGHRLGASPEGPAKPELGATVNPQSLVTEINATLIFGA